MTKGFFTKKSVALILAIIVLVGFSCFGFANAQSTSQQSKAPIPPTFTVNYSDGTNTRFLYQGNGNWYSNTPMSGGFYEHGVVSNKNPIYTQSELSAAPYNMPANISALATQYDTDLVVYNTSIGRVTETTKEFSLAEWVGGMVGKGVSLVAGSVGSYASDAITFLIQFFFIPIASIGLAIAGTILDYAVQYTIFGTGFSAMSTSIQSIWVLIRDIANVCFIFLLLYAAIKQIIWGEASKEILKSVIIAAVLINFSLFITRVVVDASNLVATSLYNQITVTSDVSGNLIGNVVKDFGTGIAGGSSTIDLSGRIMDGLGLTTMFDVNGSGSNAGLGVITGIGGLLFSVLKLVTFWITTFVFFVLAGLLVSRFVTLVILMATSPIGFLDEVGIPSITGYSREWRKSLTDQVLMAPTIMFFMLLTIQLSKILASNPLSGNPMIIFFNFFLVTYLLLKSVSVAKEMSGKLGDIVGKFASAATGMAVSAATGGTAFIARQTAGRFATNLGNTKDNYFAKRLEAIGAEGGFIKSRLAKGVLGGIQGTAKSTFDVRATDTFTGGLKRAEGLSDMTMIDKRNLTPSGTYGKGKGQTTGFVGALAAKTKEIEEAAKGYAKSSFESEKAADNKLKEFEEREKELKEKIDKETNEGKKADLEKELKVVTKQKNITINKSSAGLDKIVKEKTENLTKDSKSRSLEADTKVKQYQDQLARDKKTQEETRKKLEAEGKNVDKFDEDAKKANTKNEEEIAKLQKIIETEEKRQGEIEKQIRTEVEEDARSGKYGANLELTLRRRDMKKNYAKYLRERFLTAYTRGENVKFAKNAEKVEYNEEKEKEKAKEKEKEDKIIEKAKEAAKETAEKSAKK